MSRLPTWTLNDEAKLIGLWCDGVPSAEIEERFDGRYTAAACRQKARKLNLPKRRSGYTHKVGYRRAAVETHNPEPSYRTPSLPPLPPRRSA